MLKNFGHDTEEGMSQGGFQESEAINSPPQERGCRGRSPLKHEKHTLTHYENNKLVITFE